MFFAIASSRIQSNLLVILIGVKSLIGNDRGCVSLIGILPVEKAREAKVLHLSIAETFYAVLLELLKSDILY